LHLKKYWIPFFNGMEPLLSFPSRNQHYGIILQPVSSHLLYSARIEIP
jgi:hypothetical protein